MIGGQKYSRTRRVFPLSQPDRHLDPVCEARREHQFAVHGFGSSSPFEAETGGVLQRGGELQPQSELASPASREL